MYGKRTGSRSVVDQARRSSRSIPEGIGRHALAAPVGDVDAGHRARHRQPPAKRDALFQRVLDFTKLKEGAIGPKIAKYHLQPPRLDPRAGNLDPFLSQERDLPARLAADVMSHPAIGPDDAVAGALAAVFVIEHPLADPGRGGLRAGAASAAAA